MRNIVMTISYDGTNYHGWQCQPNAVTVQEVFGKTVEKILNHPAKIYAGGRTDTGVHAMGQVVNFHTEKEIELNRLVRGLNSLLPRDIRVKDAREADSTFHARYSAKAKTYVYCILNAPQSSPFLERYVWHLPNCLDVSAMDKAAKLILGEHDFSSFKKKDEMYKSTVRQIVRSAVKRKGDTIYFVAEAQGFLRYMVRNIVGTIALVGSGKVSIEEFSTILEMKERERAGPTAPAKGLFLRKIRY
jgi:tRNA pseudouridine38-40 synthase